MDASTKKLLYFGGGALLVGAVGFFVYSFFKKDEVTIGNTTLSLGDDEVESTKSYNFGDKIDFAPLNLETTPLSELWAKLK